MLKIAIYGKGGIGKSTMTSNLAAAFAYLGKKVIQIGCDPKADSTFNLLGGHPVQPVMNYLREHDEDPESIEDISRIGYGGVLCIETGGPTPGLGCAGRGIIATFSLLEDLGLFEKYEPDVVLYDVLGDVVCGGFAAPIREGYAEQVLIVTSGEKWLSTQPTTSIRLWPILPTAAMPKSGASSQPSQRPRRRSEGPGLCRKGSPFHRRRHSRSDDINRYEDLGQTVIEGDPDLPISHIFLDLAQKLLQDKE